MRWRPSGLLRGRHARYSDLVPLVVRSKDSLATAGLVLAVLAVVSAPLMMGGVEPISLSVIVVLAFAGYAFHVVGRLRARRPTSISFAGLPFALGGVLALVALLPMPDGLLAFLSPEGMEERAFVTALLPEAVRGSVKRVLALEPGETANVFVRMVAATLVFLVVADACRHRRPRRLAYRMVLVGALLVFFVSLVHRLANTDEIYGIYRAYGASPLRGPMLNANHQARVFGALSLLCMWRALVVRVRAEQLWFAFAGILCGAGVFLTLSRGGMLAYVVIALFSAVIFFRAPPSDEQEGAQAEPMSSRVIAFVAAEMTALLAIALALYVAREAVVDEIATLGVETPETSKAMLYGPALALLDGYGRTGVTSGGFVAAYPSRIEPQTLPSSTFEYVENIAIQTLVDHGYVVGGALLLLALFLLLRILLSLRSRVQLVALPALLFLITGDLFDFALETPAGLLLAAFSLGMLAAHLTDDGVLTLRARPPIALALLALALLVTGIMLPRVFTETRRATDAAIAAAQPDDRVAALERALALHPHDGHLCYLLAVEARRARDLPRALDWANRALLLWPNHGGAHVEAARALAAAGRLEQALIEYKLAWVSRTANRRMLLQEVAKRTPDLTLRLRAVPEDDDNAVGQVCAELRREKRLDDVQRCFDDADGRFAGVFTHASVETALERKDPVGARARIVDENAPQWRDGKGAVLLLRTLALTEGQDVAWARSEALVKGARDLSPLLSWRYSTALARNDFSEALKTLSAMRPRARSRDEVDNLDRQEAELALRMDRKGDALKILRPLSKRRPKDVALVLRTAELELSLGLLDDAKRTHARAIPLEPDSARVIALGLKIESALDRAKEERVKAIVEGRSGE
jgi:tetratricopeptide (TPR) repeat protein